jgi:tRNA-Thr(GGU) m(6)t(6)A37 methyltransferase TsaA
MKKAKKKPPSLKFIGEIRTPFDHTNSPHYADENLSHEARIIIAPKYQPGLKNLDMFNYIYVLFYLDRPHKPMSLVAHPPRLKGKAVGVFASRSPNRPNPIALSVVRLKRIEKGVLITSAIDAYDHTPVLDIKPYFKGDDDKNKSNDGWLKQK